LQEKTRVENLSESNIDDLIYVCSSKRLNDPIHKQGIELKKQWLRKMLNEYGSIAKIAYYNDKPVAQILYYPEEADVTKASKRKNVLVIMCVYNPTSTAQRHGIATELLRGVIQDAKHRKTCLYNEPCKFILAKAFDTGELLPMSEFYRKNGFLPTPEGSSFYLPIEGNYEPATPTEEYEPLSEDENKAVIFFGPTCQFSYPFAKRIEELIREVAPDIKIEMVDEWEKPEESVKRKNWWLIVNARAIKTFFMDTARFKEEIGHAIGKKS